MIELESSISWNMKNVLILELESSICWNIRDFIEVDYFLSSVLNMRLVAPYYTTSGNIFLWSQK